MPDLETFFEFGGTVELLTTDTRLAKYDIIMSEIMWGVDQGIKDKKGFIQVQARRMRTVTLNTRRMKMAI